MLNSYVHKRLKSSFLKIGFLGKNEEKIILILITSRTKRKQT